MKLRCVHTEIRLWIKPKWLPSWLSPIVPCLESPELDTVLHIRPHQGRAEGEDHLPPPAGHTFLMDTRILQTPLAFLPQGHTTGSWSACLANCCTLIHLCSGSPWCLTDIITCVSQNYTGKKKKYQKIKLTFFFLWFKAKERENGLYGSNAKTGRLPHDDLEVSPNLLPFDSWHAAKLSFLYLKDWQKKRIGNTVIATDNLF